MLQLDHEQVKAIAKQRLNEEDLASFLEKLRINIIIEDGAEPLLLICYFDRVRGIRSMGDDSLTRGRVYEIAFTAMLGRLDGC